MGKLRITEYLDIDLGTETWCCAKCGHALGAAAGNYKLGCLVAERDLAEVHPPMTVQSEYSSFSA
jgi:acetophenone carboxylase